MLGTLVQAGDMATTMGNKMASLKNEGSPMAPPLAGNRMNTMTVPSSESLPNVATLNLIDGIMNKLNCWNFFSVMKTILDEFIFSLHILDNIISLPGLYVRNVAKHYQHTTLEKLLPAEVCNDLFYESLCKKKIGYPGLDKKIRDKYKSKFIQNIATVSPPISEKMTESFPLKDLTHYEFPNSEFAFYYVVEQFEGSVKKMDALIQKFETILKSDSVVDRKKMNPSSAITLQLMTDFESVKDFVYCGDVHLGRIEDTKGICSKHLMITDNKLEIPLVYNPDFIQLSDIDVDKYKTREWLPYIRSIIVTMKLDEIAKLVISKLK